MTEWTRYFQSKKRNIFNRSINCRRLLAIIMEFTPPGGHILEVGCGTGILSYILADCGFKVMGLDIDIEALNRAKVRFASSSSKLTFVQGNMLNLSSHFQNGHFDTVFSKGVMEHFNDEDIIKGLNEQRKVARRVIFNVPNSRARKSFGDERLLSNAAWIRLIKKADFKNVALFGDYDIKRLTYFLPILAYHRNFSFIWKYFSNHSIFVCE